MTKTICDICGKEMSSENFLSKIEDQKFRISSYGSILDICTECRDSNNRWMTIRKQTRWIPVDESLPEGSGNVLVTDGEDVFIGWRLDGKWYSDSHDYYEFSHPIIAWIPLPEPYDPQESEE